MVPQKCRSLPAASRLVRSRTTERPWPTIPCYRLKGRFGQQLSFVEVSSLCQGLANRIDIDRIVNRPPPGVPCCGSGFHGFQMRFSQERCYPRLYVACSRQLAIFALDSNRRCLGGWPGYAACQSSRHALSRFIPSRRGRSSAVASQLGTLHAHESVAVSSNHAGGSFYTTIPRFIASTIITAAISKQRAANTSTFDCVHPQSGR